MCTWYNHILYNLSTENSADIVVLRLEQSNECKLKGKFSALITFAIRTLEEKGGSFFEEFKSYIIAYFPHNSVILRASKYRQIFDQICHENKWNYMTYLPLFEILKHFIGEESEDKRSDYQHAVTAYHTAKSLTETMSRTNLTKICRENEPLCVTVHEIQMKLHPHKISKRSLSYVEAVWDSMSEFLSIPPVKTVVDCMPSFDTETETEADYISATLPPRTSESLVGQGEQSWKTFMEENKIKEILFDNKCVYSVQ